MSGATRNALVLGGAIWAVLILVALLTRPLFPVDETRYLTVAWEMFGRGDYLVPHLNGAPYHHKPPLLFWAINLAWAVFGVSETAARLVASLFALGAIGLTAWLARLLWPTSRTAPAFSLLILAGTGLYAFIASLVMFDVALTCFVLLALVGMVLVRKCNQSRWWLLFGLGLGLGVLTKGPVALAHLLPVPLLAPLWVTGSAGGARAVSWGRWYAGLAGGVLFGAAIALAWALPAAHAGGEEYGQMILWGQTGGRVVHSFAHQRPVYFYFLALPAMLFPWLLWPALWRRAASSRFRSWDEGLRLTAVWILSVLLLFTVFSAKQVHYMMPWVPAFALFAGRLADGMGRGSLVLPSLLLLPVGLVFLLLPAVAPWLVGMHARVPDWLGDGNSMAGLLLVAGAVAVAALTRRQGPLQEAAQVAGGACLSLLLALTLQLFAAGGLFAKYDLKPAAEFVARHQAAGIATVKYQGEFGFLGRLTRPVEEIPFDGIKPWMKAHPGGVVVLSYRDALPDLGPAPAFDMAYRNRRLAAWLAPARD